VDHSSFLCRNMCPDSYLAYSYWRTGTGGEKLWKSKLLETCTHTAQVIQAGGCRAVWASCTAIAALCTSRTFMYGRRIMGTLQLICEGAPRDSGRGREEDGTLRTGSVWPGPHLPLTGLSRSAVRRWSGRQITRLAKLIRSSSIPITAMSPMSSSSMAGSSAWRGVEPGALHNLPGLWRRRQASCRGSAVVAHTEAAAGGSPHSGIRRASPATLCRV
jgi:hypothetical protein